MLYEPMPAAVLFFSVGELERPCAVDVTFAA